MLASSCMVELTKFISMFRVVKTRVLYSRLWVLIFNIILCPNLPRNDKSATFPNNTAFRKHLTFWNAITITKTTINVTEQMLNLVNGNILDKNKCSLCPILLIHYKKKRRFKWLPYSDGISTLMLKESDTVWKVQSNIAVL